MARRATSSGPARWPLHTSMFSWPSSRIPPSRAFWRHTRFLYFRRPERFTRSVKSTLLMFDPIQAPPLRHAFELVNATILEADRGFRHEVLNRARHQDFTGPCFRGGARADVKGETEHLCPAYLVFASVQPHPDFQPQRAHGLADCSCAADPGGGRAERRPQPVPRRHDFLAAQGLQLAADGSEIMLHHLRPARIAEPRGFLGGAVDIDDEDRGERLLEFGATIDTSAPGHDASGQRFVA